jgi:hypothetical protein
MNKKTYPLFLLLILLSYNASCQISSVKFDIYNSFFAQTYAHPGCPTPDRGVIPASSYAQTIFGYEWRTVSGVPGAGYYGKNPMAFGGTYQPEGGWHKTQDGFTINYPFIAGHQYEIVFKCNFTDIDPNYGLHPSALQVGLVNSPQYLSTRDCFLTESVNPVYNLFDFTNPAGEFLTDNNSVNFWPNFSFKPTQNYSHLWINAKTAVGFKNWGVCYIHEITINEINPISETLYTGDFSGLPTAYLTRQFNYTTSQVVGTKIMMNNNPILYVNQSIYSPNHNTRLTLQSDGNLVIYHKNRDGTESALWGTNSISSNASNVIFQTDCNLVLVSNSNTSLWASNLLNLPNGAFKFTGSDNGNYPFLTLQDDGNLVCYWPSVTAAGQQCYVIFGATDSGGFLRSAHQGSFAHPATTNTVSGTSFRIGGAH